MPSFGPIRLGRSWLPWPISLVLVLAVHGGVLLRLRQAVPEVGPAVPAAILMDLAPEPAATPEPDQVQPSQPEITSQIADETRPPEPPPAEPAPPPDATPQIVPDVAPPARWAEVKLLKPGPPPRPAVPRPITKIAEAAAPPPRPATALPLAAPPGPAASPPSRQVLASWQGQLLAHLARFKRFPPDAQRRGEQGTVLMRVIMSNGGEVVSMTMAQGSGYADLDAEAQAWITRAEPLPAFPPEMTARRMDLVIPLRFTLR